MAKKHPAGRLRVDYITKTTMEALFGNERCLLVYISVKVSVETDGRDGTGRADGGTGRDRTGRDGQDGRTGRTGRTGHV